MNTQKTKDIFSLIQDTCNDIEHSLYIYIYIYIYTEEKNTS